MSTISVLHSLTLFLTVTVCTGCQHGLVAQEESFICFLSVNAGFKAAVDFNDFRANEWQSTIDCYFHRKLNGGVGFIKTCQ